MSRQRPYFVSPGWKIVFIDLGVDPGVLLRRAGLPGDLFGRESASITSAEFFGLWRALDAEVADPYLPLRLGEALSAESFDPLVFAALCSESLNAALTRIAQYKRLMGAMVMHVEVTDASTIVRLDWGADGRDAPAVLVLFELVYFTALARIGTRKRVAPNRVVTPALPALRGEYTEYFGVPLTKGAVPQVVFSAADAARPFVTANEAMWRVFEPSLKRRLADIQGAASTEERVRAALLELLPSGQASLASVARRLGMSVRTLSRRLKEEGQGFQVILDGTREQLALHYLKSTAMSGSEISFLLGFEDPNSFVRAFHVWTGTTPERVRRSGPRAAD